MKIFSVLSILAFAIPLWAQSGSQTLFEFDGAFPSNHLGRSVAIIGDVNSDGRQDFVLTGSGSPFGAMLTQASIVSGLDGELIYTIDLSTSSLGGFDRVASLGDIDNDGFGDFIMRFTGNGGAVSVYSGQFGQVLFTHGFGGSVASAGDVDNDGTLDYIIASLNMVSVFSGSDGSVIHVFPGVDFGSATDLVVASAGDVDADGFDDVMVGVPTDPSPGGNAGETRVYSGATGGLLFSLDIFQACAAAGDVNVDGFDDIVVATADPVNGSAGATIEVFSGFDGTLLYRIEGSFSSDNQGISVCGGQDVDGDGIPDIVVGLPGDDSGMFNGGSIKVYSGVDGSLRFSKNGNILSGLLGTDCDLGDINLDGLADVIVGEPGRTTQAAEDGLVSVLSIVPFDRYQGSREDFVMFTALNEVATESTYARTAVPGDIVSIHINSPNSSLEFTQVLIAAQPFVIGDPPLSPQGYPDVYINPSPFHLPIVLLYGDDTIPFNPIFLIPGGISLNVFVSPALVGFGARIQAIAFSPSANSIITSTDAHEIFFP